ncbi:MAG: glycosyltransferase [Rubrivivax sp.]
MAELSWDDLSAVRQAAPGQDEDGTPELTILMPCLNEARTLPACIGKAQAFLREQGIRGEVLIADNGSSDGSATLAQALGARVVQVPARGYGAALIAGIGAARGRHVIMVTPTTATTSAHCSLSSRHCAGAPSSSWETAFAAASRRGPCLPCTATWATRC